MDKTRITQMKETRVITEDGEVISKLESTDMVVEKEPDYIKLYLQDLTYLKELPKSFGSVLFSIAKRMNYENEVILIKAIKDEIAKENNMTPKSLDNAIARLKKESILINKARGIYIINPYYLAKGYWKDIKKLRMEIEYTPNGKTIKVLNENNQTNLKSIK